MSHSFEVTQSKVFPNSNSVFDWVLIKPESLDSLNAIQALAQQHPSRHITILASKAQLNNKSFYEKLLQFTANCSVLPSDQWDSLFWLELRTILNRKTLLRDVSRAASADSTPEAETLLKRSQAIVAQLEKDVTLAEAIQRSLLPRHMPTFPGIAITTKYMPAAGLGGDYFDVFEFGDKKRIGIILADSKTHGMAAALLSVLLKIRTDEMKERFPNSHSFVSHLNEQIQQFHAKDLASLSLLYGIFDRTSLTFQYTSAGPLTPIWARGKKVLPTVVSESPAIGSTTHFPFHEETLQLRPGDFLLLHTDGLEAPIGMDSGSGGENVTRAVERLLAAHPTAPDSIELQNEFLALIDRYRDRQPLPDDLTVIQLAIDPNAIYVAKKFG